MPRPLIAAAVLLLAGCNEIRYQTARLRAKAATVEAPKLAALPDHRTTYECRTGEPFDVYFPPGGVGAVLSIGGDDYSLRSLETVAGRRFSDGSLELYMKEDGSVDLSRDEKKIRTGCKAE